MASLDGMIAFATPYTIASSTGTVLQLSSGSVLENVTLAVDARLDEQQWVFWPSAANDGAWKIENYKFNGSFASEIYSSTNETFLGAAREGTAKEWYVAMVTSPYYYVCFEPSCITAWASNSASDAGGTLHVSVTPATGISSELWKITLASGTSPPAGGTVSPVLTMTSIPFAIPTATFGTTTQSTATSTESSSSSPTVDTQKNLQVLSDCEPCGKSSCTFTPSGTPSLESYSILIGQAVSNCDANSESDTVTKIGGALELERSWSVQTTSGAGLGYFGPSISFTTTVGTGQTKRVSVSQETEVTIKKGQIGALVANVSYTTHGGTLNVGSTATLPFMSIEPEYVLGVSVVYTGCDSPFQGLTTPKKFVCSRDNGSSSRTPRKGMFLWLWMAFLWTILTAIL